MPISILELATETRTAVCEQCRGCGEVSAGVASGIYNMAQAQWHPDETVYTCPTCKGAGDVQETRCLRCTETTYSCSCTDEQIESFLLSAYLGAA